MKYFAILLCAGSLVFNDAQAQTRTSSLTIVDGANSVKLQAPASGGALTITLPSTDGTNGQVLQTDGSGGLSWGASGSSLPSGAIVTFGSSSNQSGYTYTGHSTSFGNTWSSKASSSTAHHAAAIGVVNNKIYVIGGSTSPVSGQISNNNEYDPATNSWTAKTGLPTARRYVMSAVHGGKIYVIGGSIGAGAGTAQSTVEAYDPATNNWTTLADMPTPRMSGVAATVNGKIYVVGGHNSGGAPNVFYDVTEEYDPATNTWSTKASVPAGWAASGVAVANDKIYVVGGQDNSNTTTNVFEYDPATDTWASETSLPAATTGPCAVGFNGKIYIFGGCLASANIAFNTAREYDPSTNTYTSLTNMSTARISPMAALVNGKIYVIGGAQSDGTRLTANEEYSFGLNLYYFTKN